MPELFKEGLSMFHHYGYELILHRLQTIRPHSCNVPCQYLLDHLTKGSEVLFEVQNCKLLLEGEHKKHCKVLAKLRKDNAKESEMVKNF
jgi:hypothetical protein